MLMLMLVLVRRSARHRACDGWRMGERGCTRDVQGGQASCAVVRAAREEGGSSTVELGEIAPCIGGSQRATTGNTGGGARAGAGAVVAGA